MATYSSILAWRIPMDRGAWRVYNQWDHKESDTTERLSTAHTLSSFFLEITEDFQAKK